MVVPLVAAALLASACGGGTGEGATQPQQAGRNDINPRPVAELKDGGELKLAVNGYPVTFNYLHVNGNEADIFDVVTSLMPTPVRFEADGTAVADGNYLESMELTSRDPQVVTFRLNQKAHWSDGTPITWEDYRSQWRAMNRSNPEYQISAANGYEAIGSVERGRDDFEAVITFSRKFADWKSIYEILYPKSMTGDPASFNTGWKDRPLLTGGAFRVAEVNPGAKTVSVVRDESWWGDKPKLDRIVFRTVPNDGQIDALANGELDVVDIADDLNAYQRATALSTIDLRRALAPNYRHITFNGAKGAILEDVELRLALQKAIDRTVMTNAMVGQISPGIKPLNNHIYVEGLKHYKDNSGLVAHDPEAAKRKLDELGWKLEGEVRKKDGRELRIRDLIPANKTSSEQEAKLVQQQLGQIGVKVEIVSVPIGDFFEKHVKKGNFDLTHFAWIGTPFPITSSGGIYKLQDQMQQNYGRIGNEKINELYERATEELDEQKAADLANQLDEEIWKSGHSLVTYQRPDVVAVRKGLANVGAHGFQRPTPYSKIGYVNG
ncbi:peptide/nickel transport system substrate-binding protein [Streptoalloteichus tenebrarius]|uniref:Peptide/nickel transport system substrate-binding protein n=2 Tax=Streptoalloteichus tenebrarius (strain ATCC 17920 / DSM 40477 / JCM 4838 / CBS 697.72 / NBRC 16177 / NCIMB 11028 / NRRL B-12390 / A12253. 1 / ISP 5477) TaxID=1933 RepID=A0ABT1HVU6_STRSD|nr:peptide/nickel transport system substrate-binding protein [Streptoalloteichus tenebrarius]